MSEKLVIQAEAVGLRRHRNVSIFTERYLEPNILYPLQISNTRPKNA